MAKKIVMAELRADVAGLRSDLNGAARMFEQLNSRIERMQSAQTSKGGRGGRFDLAGGLRERFGGAMETAKAVAVGGAFYGAASEMKVIRDYEKALVDLAVSGGESAAYLSRMREKINGVSDAYGIAKEDVLSFAQEIVTATGDTKLAESQLAAVGKVAYASGAEMKDLAGVMVQLQNVAQIPIGESNTAFGVLIEQAQKGSFELKDMARLLPGVITYMGTFGKTGVKSMGEISALLQVAKRAVPSSEEAAVAVMRMFDAISVKREKIEKTLGIKLMDDKGQYKGISEMMQLIAGGIAARKGQKVGTGKNAMDIEGWAQMTFDVRGSKIMRQLVNQAKAGWSTKVGNYETYSALAGATGEGAVEKMYQSRRSLSGTGDWAKSMNEFRNHMHQTLLPIVQKLAAVMPQLASAGKFAADNLGTLVAVLAASKLLSLTNAWSLAAAKAATTSAAAATSSAVVSARMAAAGSALMGLGMALMVAWDLYKGKDSLLVKTTKKVGTKLGDAVFDAINPEEKGLSRPSDASNARMRTKAFDLALSRSRAGINMSSDYMIARDKLTRSIQHRKFLIGRADDQHTMGIRGEYTDKDQILASQTAVEANAAEVRKQFFKSFSGREATLLKRHLPKEALGRMIPELNEATSGSDANAIRATKFREEEGNRLRKQTADGIVAIVGYLKDSFSIVPKKGKTGTTPK